MNSVSFTWTVDEIDLYKDFTTRRNVKKNVLTPRYQGYLGDGDVPCAFVSSKEITPASSLGMIKTEDSISENSASDLEGDTQWAGTSYFSTAKYFLLTDVFGDYLSRTPVPLYYKHVLPDGNIEPSSIAILDKDLAKVYEHSYRVVRIEEHDDSDVVVADSYEECAVYSNYINSLDEETGESKIYFVRYEVSGQTHYQLLNQQPAYSLATYQDLSLVSGLMKSWRKVYTLSPGVVYYTVSVPVSKTYFIRPLERGKIALSKPVYKDDTDPWFVTVSNGAFSSIRNDQVYSFSVPEYENQDFSPLYPYKVSVEEEAIRVRGDILKVSQQNLKVDSSTYIMEVLIKDYAGNTLYALTTDSSINGDYLYEGIQRVSRTIGSKEEWITWDGNGIVGWDEASGFIHLGKNYSDTYQFLVTYYYEETKFELTSLNLNPVFDEEYDDHFYAIYVVPTGGDNANTGTQSRSVQWLKVNRSGRIVDVSQKGVCGNFDFSEYYTDGQYSCYSKEASSEVYSDLNPAGAASIAISSGSSFPSQGIAVWTDGTGTRRVVGYSSKGIYWSGTQSYSRLILSSQTLPAPIPEGTTIYLHSFRGLFSSDGENNYQWFLLGEVRPSSTSTPDSLSIIDIRKTGGVIKPEYYEAAIKIDPKAVWARPEAFPTRGQCIPGETASIVKIPFTLLEEYGGSFTRTNIEDIVSSRHLATGVLPVILFTGGIPEIETITSSDGNITITWYTEGSSFSYNVYYSSARNGPWTQANDSLISDQSYGPSYTITGLTPRLIYYVIVTSVNSDGVESPQSIAWGIKVTL